MAPQICHLLGILVNAQAHAELGVESRPTATRVRSRKAISNLSQVPSSRHWAKSSYIVLLGDKSYGNISYW